MKTINLYFDFEFTSLSPDAQPISLGIVSDGIEGAEWIDAGHCGVVAVANMKSKSFYAEFTDFDINRCDDWVKEKVVSKLKMAKCKPGIIKHTVTGPEMTEVNGDIGLVASELKSWLIQLYDYEIQFIADCGTWDWYWMVQLLAEWDNKFICQSGEYKTAKESKCKGCYAWDCNSTYGYKTGLPKLPTNISPVPEDLNDLIARKQGISVREAFDLNREELAYGKMETMPNLVVSRKQDKMIAVDNHLTENKHNALWDAKVIKEIYQKLK